MSLADTSAALLTARRALGDAELAHANAIAAEVRASVPGPWVAFTDKVTIDGSNVTVFVWWDGAWWACAYACPDPLRWRGPTSDECATPRAALEDLALLLRRSRGAEGRSALRIVVRLLRGWV